MKEKNINSFLRFENYIADSIVFKNNPNFEGDEIEVKFNIDSDINVIDKGKGMLVSLEVDIFENATKNNYPFEMSVSLIGYFTMQGEEDDIIRYKRNAVAILYPYIRAIVTNYTANANVNPLVLPTINVNKLIEEKNEN